MSAPRAFGLEWDEAEIDLAGWQGITALRFAASPPPGAVAELIVALAKAADGLVPADLELVAPDGAGLEGPGLHGEVQPIAGGATEVRVVFTDLGPRGACRVRLVSGGADPLHPFFAEAGFDFYIDCPAGDCRVAAEPEAPVAQAEPAIDLATKDFDGFVKVAQNWALSTDPNWSDLTPAATEQMLIELLAHHADLLSLHQDRVAQEAFIDTARERLSLRRHAAFLGLALDEGASAAATVAVDVAPGAQGFLPAATRIVRQEAAGRITNTFTTLTPQLLDGRWNAGLADPADRGQLRPAAWPGAPDAALPIGTTSLLLLDWELNLMAGQRLAFVQGRAAHLARLVRIEEIEAPGWSDAPEDAPGLVPRKVTHITWDVPTAVRFAPWEAPEARPFLVTANLVDVVHGTPRRALTRPDGDAVPLTLSRQDAVLATDPGTGELQLRAVRTPETDVLVAADGRPDLSLTIGREAWSWQPDLWTSAGFDRHYTTEREEDGSVWLLFGDGRRGRAVPVMAAAGAGGLGGDAVVPLDEVTLAYRRGVAQDGNLGAFALNAALPPVGDDASAATEFSQLGIRTATNLLPAAGGRQAVSLEVARQLIPESIRNPARERCVTAADYARAAEAVPGIAQAAAKPLGGLFNTIVVLCAPAEGDDLAPDLAAAVFDHLDSLRMAGREHVVRPPDYVPLDIALLVCRRAGAGAAAVRAALRAALAPGTAARPGFFHRSRLGFGAEVRQGDILAAAGRAEGVGAVRVLAFRPLFGAGGEAVRRVIRLAPTQIAQFAADEARPERGRLTIRIEGIDRPEPPGAFRVGGPAPEPADLEAVP